MDGGFRAVLCMGLGLHVLVSRIMKGGVDMNWQGIGTAEGMCPMRQGNGRPPPFLQGLPSAHLEAGECGCTIQSMCLMWLMYVTLN